MAEEVRGRIVFATTVPPAAKPYLEIRVPLPGQPVVGVVVCPVWLVLPTHYDHPRTHPHYDPPETCPWCKLRIAVRHRCFAGAWDYKTGRYFIQQFSPSAAASCKQLRELQGCLRGWQLTTIRAGKSQQSRVLARVEYYRERDLPPEFPLAAALERIYTAPAKTGGHQ